MSEIEEQARPLSQRVGTRLAGRALRPLGEHGAPDAAAQSGHNAAGAVLAQQGALLRVQSEFMRPAFDAVKEVDDFEQPGTERTAGLGPSKNYRRTGVPLGGGLLSRPGQVVPVDDSFSDRRF